MKMIFDVGMFDGSDTEYYLSLGFDVVAVEANPNLVRKVSSRLERHIDSGRLRIVNRAIGSNSNETLELTVSGDDLGSSSTLLDKVQSRNPIGTFSVQSISLSDLIAEYGCPHFLKVDIEGSDRHCVLPLTSECHPEFLSFEAGDDIHELVRHLASVGYTKFKAINQRNFFELRRQIPFQFRLRTKAVYLLGFAEPRYMRLNGRLFLLGHSAGPPPWLSDGHWQDALTFLTTWDRFQKDGKMDGWYDVHAC